ncbi:hypothetical protein MRX96_016101 [Rhipicephalus microplus]
MLEAPAERVCCPKHEVGHVPSFFASWIREALNCRRLLRTGRPAYHTGGQQSAEARLALLSLRMPNTIGEGSGTTVATAELSGHGRFQVTHFMTYKPHHQEPPEVIVYCVAEIADVIAPNSLCTSHMKARQTSLGLSTRVHGKDLSFRHRERLTDVPLEGGHTLECLLHTGTRH